MVRKPAEFLFLLYLVVKCQIKTFWHMMMNIMRYAIITNPASGNMTADMKLSILAEAAAILDAEIFGLETDTADDLSLCAQELINHCDVLVVAGGDGTLSDVINAIDTSQFPIAYLPLGTANAMRYALNYKGNLADISMRIKKGGIHRYDLINCDGPLTAKLFSHKFSISDRIG